MRRSAVDIYLSDREIAAVDGAGLLWHSEAESPDAALAGWAQHVAGIPRPKRVRVWLGGSLCRPVRIASVSGNLTREERLRLAEQAAIAQSGLEQPCRVLFDVAGGEDVLAIVAAEAVLASISRALKMMRLSAASIQPWWGHLLTAALRLRPKLRAFGVSEGNAMTVLTGDGGRFSAAYSLWPVEDVDAAAAAFTRTLISAMIPSDDALAFRVDWSREATGDASVIDAGSTSFAAWLAPLELPS